MSKKLTSLIGLSKVDFDEFRSSGEIQVRPARLIPVLKAGDEMALTSVFLSALRMIDEFRDMIFSDIKMPRGGQLFFYTEVSLPGFEDSRVDGLALVVKSGKIKDAALFEMKNESNELREDQIQKYLEIAKRYSIPRLVTISNQFVSTSSQFPIPIKAPKDVSLYHFSWTYILTIAHILLFKNDINIEDQDQVEIMKEVVAYLENDKCGVSGFNQMKAGWKDLIERINTGARLKASDSDLEDAVSSWQQEEKDMALILSKKLGVFVTLGSTKAKNDLKVRLEADKKHVIEKKELVSSFRVKGAVSDITVCGLLEKRTIEMSVDLIPPADKTEKGKIGWFRNQLNLCEKKDSELYLKLHPETIIEVGIKNTSHADRFLIGDIDRIIDEIKGKEIRSIKLVYVRDFGKSFSNRKKFVSIIEEMLLDFYECYVQHLKNWEKPAPKVAEKKIAEPISDYLDNVPLHSEESKNTQ